MLCEPSCSGRYSLNYVSQSRQLHWVKATSEAFGPSKSFPRGACVVSAKSLSRPAYFLPSRPPRLASCSQRCAVNSQRRRQHVLMASQLQQDPYEVLQVAKTASADEIKSAYRKLALRYHPDKNQGANADEASQKFQIIVTAYGILNDPDKRRRYDVGGFDSLDTTDREIHVDLSSLGVVSTAVAALFTKLGVPVKTIVGESVWQALAAGNFEAVPLTFGKKHSDKVDKGGIVVYDLHVTQQHIRDGFAIGAYSPQGSRFKLLLFQQDRDGEWGQLAQEDSQKGRKGMHMAGLYFFPFLTCTMGPKPSMLDNDPMPGGNLFKRLDSLQARDLIDIQPGRTIVAVYGDSWFSKVKYTIQAVHTPSHATPASPADSLQQAEAQLLKKKTELQTFGAEFRQVQSQYLGLVERAQKQEKEVEELIQMREQAYLDLLEGSNAQLARPS